MTPQVQNEWFAREYSKLINLTLFLEQSREGWLVYKFIYDNRTSPSTDRLNATDSILILTNKRNLTREKHDWVYSKNIEVRQVFFKASSGEFAVKQVG